MDVLIAGSGMPQLSETHYMIAAVLGARFHMRHGWTEVGISKLPDISP